MKTGETIFCAAVAVLALALVIGATYFDHHGWYCFSKFTCSVGAPQHPTGPSWGWR